MFQNHINQNHGASSKELHHSNADFILLKSCSRTAGGERQNYILYDATIISPQYDVVTVATLHTAVVFRMQSFNILL